MNARVRAIAMASACLVLASACQDGGSAATPAPSREPSPAAPASIAHPATTTSAASATVAAQTGVVRPTLGPESWLGRWNGPEGTFLEIERDPPGYRIRIRDLDGEAEYAGDAAGPGLGFDREGTNETIRAGNGKQTGMKWLADKQDCLVVRTGEGYCRD